ncbi:acyltransferase family protein [Salipiger mangrovisoli]|uniref:Acyltransferase n=1 Tax=Salipiger mangrovisoli TaxID=2865933 RepID=A0ABR9XAC4_9RHOB|nr:acyltransferase [Salipiger mangrovisoli]MBE9640452.1 acyltransferase [Salipiger mangrovisoli]
MLGVFGRLATAKAAGERRGGVTEAAASSIRTPLHNALLDYLRFAASLVIVLFHTGSLFKSADQAAVGFFAMVMTYFTLSGFQARKTSLPSYLKTRARRLLYPCLLWAALHIIGKAAAARFEIAPLRADLVGWLPPHGTMAQLWFLPCAFACTALLAMAFHGRPPVSGGGRHGAAMTLVTLIACFAMVSVWSRQILPLFWSIWALYCTSVAIGILLFALRDKPAHLILASLCLVLTGIAMKGLGLSGTTQMTIACPLFVSALLCQLRDRPFARTLGAMSFDIYLCHVVMTALAKSLLGVDLATPSGALIACLLSVLFATAMRITRPGSWLR